MVQHVGEGRFEAQTPVLPDRDEFRQPSTDCNSAGCFEDSDASIANPSRIERSVGKRVEVEIIARRAIGRNWIADPVRPNNRSVSSWICVGLVSGYAVSRSQVRPRFQQRDCVDIPTTKDAANDR